MNRRRNQTLAVAVSFTLMASCVQVEPGPDFDRARALVEESTGRSAVFDPTAPALTQEQTAAILAAGLSLDEALHLALVNSRDLQADFQEIGIAHADWVQAQLLSNPSLTTLLRFPTGGGRGWFEATMGMELLELWRIPVRKEVAQHKLNAAVLRVARRSGEQLANARAAYYRAVAANELELVAIENVALASRSFEAVQFLHQAGAADALEESLAQGPLFAAQLARQTARIDARNAKRELAIVLSLKCPIENLQLTDPLPTRPIQVGDGETLVQLALASRLDLQAMEAAVMAMDTRVRLEERKAWGDVAAGVAVERPARTGDKLLGPSLSLTLPIFDQNQAQVARAGFQLEQMVKLHESACITVTQNVRSSVGRLGTVTASLAFFSQDLLPQAQRSFALATESYRAGQSTVLALVEVQRLLLEARRAHVALRLEAALSSSDLERVVGAPLTAR